MLLSSDKEKAIDHVYILARTMLGDKYFDVDTILWS